MLDRTRLAARAAANGRTTRNRGSIGTDLGARASTVPALRLNTRRTKGTKMTATQRSSHTGRRSEWNRSPYFRNAVTVDARWSA